MKKFAILVALTAVAFTFNSCSEDRGPKYHEPTTFVLNQPAMADQYIVLEEGNTLTLNCSQPDYGYSAIADYSAEVALTADFNETYTITPLNNHLAAMTFRQQDIATAICALLQIETEDAFTQLYPDGMPFAPLHFRAVCQLENVPTSRIVSNPVQYNYIKGYFSVPKPGVVYIVGNVNSWPTPSEDNAGAFEGWTLSEDDDAIGSHIYSADIDLPASPEFRFYTALTGWDEGDSYGSNAGINTEQFPEWTGTNDFTATAVNGKGNWSFPKFEGARVHITFNMSDPKNIIFQMGPAQNNQ